MHIHAPGNLEPAPLVHPLQPVVDGILHNGLEYHLGRFHFQQPVLHIKLHGEFILVPD
ncbi:hypothetical protein D3C81_2316330 [compost metagenome]